jgi:hypothetical protein
VLPRVVIAEYSLVAHQADDRKRTWTLSIILPQEWFVVLNVLLALESELIVGLDSV